MYQLNSIGEMTSEGSRIILRLKKEYQKALKFTERFSHMHVFYVDWREERECLIEVLLPILAVDRKAGSMEFFSDAVHIMKADVFDLKPYFPCEDSVKESVYQAVNLEEKTRIVLSKEEAEDGKYHMAEIGQIKNREGKKYIQIREDCAFPKLEGCSHAIVIWWFHKFDEAIYRRCVEGNPPYENAPRSGIFATRSPVRPNPIAMTIARLVKCDQKSRRIELSDIEGFDGTPCIAVWPYVKERDLVLEAKVPAWLAHWPKWLDDRGDTTLTGEAISRITSQEDLDDQTAGVTNEEIEALFKIEEELQSREGICIEGARENNLKGINCTLPYHKITAVVGVSGSGKSSLVQDTIYAECRRRMECLTDDARVFKKPNMDGMTGSIPAVLISQKEIGKNSRSTVGTYSNAYDYLRSIFAAVGLRHCPECGKPILPMTEEEIMNFLMKQEKVRVFTLQEKEMTDGALAERVHQALFEGIGAFYAEWKEKKSKALFQTRQKCYSCDRLMYELTPATFNYSNLESMCPQCHGNGEKNIIDVTTIIEKPQLSLLDGASSFYGSLRNFLKNSNANWMKGEVIGLAEAMGVDLEQPWQELPLEFRNKVIYGSAGETVTFHYANKRNGRNGTIVRPVEGVYHILERLASEQGTSEALNKYLKKAVCDCCNGERLNAEGRLVSIGEIRYPQAAQMTFQEVLQWCRTLPGCLSRDKINRVKEGMQRLYELSLCADHLGIGYLELNRNTATLSGGESQRLKFLSSMINRLTGVLYIMDEPSRGLHPKDYRKIADMMIHLKDNGNTVIMVEHNKDMLQIADHVIEVGPEAGERGGYLVGAGSLEAMINHPVTQLSKYYKDIDAMPMFPLQEVACLPKLEVNQIRYNNLKNIDIALPIGAITCICGVSGSGKSSLMKGVLYPEISKLLEGKHAFQSCRSIKNAELFEQVILVEQSAIGRTPRSVPATYMGIMDSIRELYAETAAAKKARMTITSFSFNNSEGQCENCHGDGQIEPKFLQDMWVTCPVCEGKRYQKSVLEVVYQGKNISEVLEMSIEEAEYFFANVAEIKKVLLVLIEVGLGYLKLGQSLTTLSGGEASRLKLAKELISKTKKTTLYLIDEPTTGLHYSDIENLLRLFRKLVKEGNTIILIEHNKQVVRNSDWVIELGPGAGKEGGAILKQGRELESL